MTTRRKLLLQLPPAAFLIWVGWGGITAPASALPNSLLKIPLFLFGLAWLSVVVVLLWRARR